MENINTNINFDEKVTRKVDNLSHSRSILAKMFNENLFCDVTLKSGVDGVTVSTHRSVLATSSEYFDKMFTGNFKEKIQKSIEIKNVSGNTLKLVISFCYTGQIEINPKNILNVLSAADLFRLEQLKKECELFLKDQLVAAPEISLDIYAIAEIYTFDKLMEQACQMVCNHFHEVAKGDTFNEISFVFLESILKSDECNCASEEDIYEAAMRWVKFKEDERKAFIPRILRVIRLTQMDSVYLTDHIKPVCVEHGCLELLVNALLWRDSPTTQTLLPQELTASRTAPNKLLVLSEEVKEETTTCLMENYCFVTKKWTAERESKLPDLVTSRQFTIADKQVYITGGFLDNLATHVAYRLDLKTLQILVLPSMNNERYFHNTAIINGSLYVLGGNDYNGALSSVECYDIATNRWRTCRSMSQDRTQVNVAVLNGFLYAIGGYNIGYNIGYLNSVERYDPSNDTWSPVASMKYNRADSGVAVLYGKIYVIGGVGVSHCEVYDPNASTWTTIASLPDNFCGGAVAIYKNTILAIGGGLNAIQQYVVRENKWIKFADWKSPKMYCAAAVIQKL